MDIKILYEDADVLVIDKPAGITVFPEAGVTGVRLSLTSKAKPYSKTLIDQLIEKYPALKASGEAPRYGVVHRLDKDTSGLLLVAKTPEALIFLQKQYKNREVEKKYLALTTGAIKEENGRVETFIGRSPADPRKQKAFTEGGIGKREAITEYKVLERFTDYTLLEVQIKTGRKHQIRCHLAYIHHPIAGDKVYGFKDSPTPEGLKRQFLHASYLKITLPSGRIKEFHSDLPEDLQSIIRILSE